MKKLLRVIILILVAYILIGLLFGLKTVTKVYNVESDKITAGVKIVQISDSHSFENYSDVVYQTKNANPDIITLTGDIFTDETKLDQSVDFVTELNTIAPVYYIKGNNDNPKGKYHEFASKIEKEGVTILEDDYRDVIINNQEIRIIGIDDNSYSTIFSKNKTQSERITNLLASLYDESKYNIVLSHRPQYFEEYVQTSSDLVLTGHTHGGMIRFPFINEGLITSDQGLFAKYDYGIYKNKNTTMIINSGCASRGYIPRLYNPKEVVILNLK